MLMTSLAAYALLFVAVGVAFLLVNLLVGKLIRPARPQAEKGTIYECGEPTIGSAWVQFDLRFYVVALLFVIFDVEVAFFFPWAVVFGRSNDLASVGALDNVQAYHAVAGHAMELVPPFARASAEKTFGPMKELTDTDLARWRELKQKQRDTLGKQGAFTPQEREELTRLNAVTGAAEKAVEEAHRLSWLAFWEILFFFGILLVGFAYLWQRGDLAWVRSLSERRAALQRPSPLAVEQELVGAGR
jgi:NADH-quinone oxidoreductase subunit A